MSRKHSKHSRTLTVLELHEFINELREVLGLKRLYGHTKKDRPFIYQEQIINDGNRHIRPKKGT